MKRKKKIENREKYIRVFWTFDILFTTRRSCFAKRFRTNKPEPEKTAFPYEPEPELFFHESKPCQMDPKLKPVLFFHVPKPCQIQLIENTEDSIRWRWTVDGEYTAKSAYCIQF